MPRAGQQEHMTVRGWTLAEKGVVGESRAEQKPGSGTHTATYRTSQEGKEVLQLHKCLCSLPFPRDPWAVFPHSVKVMPECDGNHSAVKRPLDHSAGPIHWWVLETTQVQSLGSWRREEGRQAGQYSREHDGTGTEPESSVQLQLVRDIESLCAPGLA